MPVNKAVGQTRETGREVAQVNGETPEVSAATGRKWFKAELEDLRESMRRLGLGYDGSAAEIAHRYRMRPREWYRLSWGAHGTEGAFT